MNKNIPRLGGMAAILAMAGATAVVRNSEADPSGMGRVKDQPPGWISSFGATQDSVRNDVRGKIDPSLLPPPGMDGDITNPLFLYGNGGLSAVPTPELARELVNITLDNVQLKKELDAKRAQVEELIKRLEIMETACEDATSEDGCPAGCADQFCEGIFVTSVGGNMF